MALKSPFRYKNSYFLQWLYPVPPFFQKSWVKSQKTGRVAVDSALFSKELGHN